MEDDCLYEKCLPERYSFSRLSGAEELAAYDALLAETYDPLGFSSDKVMPRAGAERHALRFDAALAGICCLTEVVDPASLYHRLVPEAAPQRQRARLIELNNFVLRPGYRGTIALALMISSIARRASEREFDYLVGTTRYQTLPYFVEFGVVPVEHEPIHLLENPKLLDFVVYYDTGSSESMAYLEQRTRRYLHQVRVMVAIREKYIRRPRALDLGGGMEAGK